MTCLSPIRAAVEVNKYSSIFCDVFSEKENLHQLYQELHPEQSIHLDEINLVDLRTDLAEKVCSYIAFMTKDKLIVVFETAETKRMQIKAALLGFFFDVLNLLTIDPDSIVYTDNLLQDTEFYVLYTGPEQQKESLLTVPENFRDILPWVKVDYHVIDTDNPKSITGQYYQFSRCLQNWLDSRKDMADLGAGLFRYCTQNDILKDYFQTNENVSRNIIINLVSQLEGIETLLNRAKEESKTESQEELIQKLLAAGLVSKEQISSFFTQDQ